MEATKDLQRLLARPRLRSHSTSKPQLAESAQPSTSTQSKQRTHKKGSNYSEISGMIDHILQTSSLTPTAMSGSSGGRKESLDSTSFSRWLERTSQQSRAHQRRRRVATTAFDARSEAVHCCSVTGRNPLNPYKLNQDRVIYYHLPPDTYLFGVCDGHGTFGHLAADFVAAYLPDAIFDTQSAELPLRDTIKAAVLACSEALLQSTLNVHMSGTTLVLAALRNKTLWCANVGDSRAILGKMHSLNKWSSVALTRDHKPDVAEEAARIRSHGGRIDCFHEADGTPVGPQRVWVQCQGEWPLGQSTPGLAISRSLGDSFAASIGVIPDPEIVELRLSSEDKFLLLGSDGLFEYFANEDLVKMVIPYWKKRDSKAAVEAVVSAARQRWEKVTSTQDEEVIDDISCIIAFLPQ